MTKVAIEFPASFEGTGPLPISLGRLAVGDGRTGARITLHPDGTVHYTFLDMARPYVHIAEPTPENALFGFPDESKMQRFEESYGLPQLNEASFERLVTACRQVELADGRVVNLGLKRLLHPDVCKQMRERLEKFSNCGTANSDINIAHVHAILTELK